MNEDRHSAGPGAGVAVAEPPWRTRFFRLTFVNILSNVTVPLVGLVDTAMLGHLPEIRFLAGVALGGVLFDYVYWSLGFLRMGTTGLVAQAVGRGDRDETYRVLYRSLCIALGLGAAMLLLQLPLRELGFAILSGETAVESAGRAYFDARIWAAPATLCNFALIGWLLGRAESRQVLVMTLAGNLSNILFNYIFIIRLGLAATGAGLATALAQYLMLAVGVGIFLSRGRPVSWSWPEVLDRRRIGALFRLNRDILIRTVCLVSAFALFTNFSAILGTPQLVANSILLRVLILAAYLIDGAAYASESLAGILLGRRDFGALRRLGRLALASGVGFAILVLGAFFSAPAFLLGLLTSHADLVSLAVGYSPWLVPTLLLGGLAYMYDGLFIGLTEGRALRNSMMISTLVVFLPAALTALWLRDNHVLWAAMVLFMVARAATLGWVFPGLLRGYEER
jgi:MATE family multidrug resistance protein